jgi:ankyrin repeat protein
MAQRQEQWQANKPQRHWERTRQVLTSAARPIKRLFVGRKLDILLIKAASDGENSEILRLLKAGASVSAKDMHGETALHEAAYYGHTQTCILIMEEYAKSGKNIQKLINAKNNGGWTALHHAALKGNTETCALLIGECAKTSEETKRIIASKDNDGQTALHRAAYYGHTQTCELIIKEYKKAGGDINEPVAAKDSYGRTAIYYAATYGHTQTVQFFESVKLLGKIMDIERIKPFLSELRGCVS